VPARKKTAAYFDKEGFSCLGGALPGSSETPVKFHFEMFQRMVNRWSESFLTTKTWAMVRKKINRSRKAWGEGE
jgi:hypothetical protein